MLFGLLQGLGFSDRRLWLAAVAMLAAQVSISALNEWADADLDARAARLRPIPLGLISRQFALVGASVLGGLALALSFTPGHGRVGTVLFTIGLGCGWLYDLVLKRMIFSFLPFAIAFPLLAVWVGVVAGRPLSALLPFFLVGAPLGIAIHLADSLPDLGSDAASNSHGLAVRLGPRRALLAIQGSLLLGSLLVVKSFLHQPPVAVLLAAVALTGASLAERTAGVHAGRTRWIATATALALAVPWLGART